MFRNKLLWVLSLVVIASMVLTACGGTVQTVEVVKTVEVTKEVVQTQVVTVKETQIVEVAAPTATPEPVTRTGGWLDLVVFTEQNSADAAISQLQSGDIDVYAYSVTGPERFQKVTSDPNLSYSNAFGSTTELTFNPAVCTDTTKLNPFSNPKIREAMNWALDRSYVVQEIYGGMAQAKFTVLNSAFPDYARYVDVSRALEAQYAYNFDKAKEVITAEMEGMGATVVDGKFQFNDAPVSVMILIRTEDERKQIGDYVAKQIADLGFTADPQYKTRSEASPIWVRGNPTDCLFNIYTGGWITTAISRDNGADFSFYYTPNDYPIPLFQAYTPTEEFNTVALKLRNNDFANMDERRALFEQALPMSLTDSVRIWIADQKSFSPFRKDLKVASDLAGGIAGSSLLPYTLRIEGQEGGAAQVSQPGVLVDPWNPVAGSNWIYDTTVRRMVEDQAFVTDPYTGLNLPQRLERAEVTVKEGLPVSTSSDYVTVNTAPEIQVPGDAWVDWDAVNQKWLTASEVYTETQTALSKTVVYYPSDLWKTEWHDGSPLTPADFMMAAIETFDRGKPESALYDASQAETLAAFMDHFKAVKFVSMDPLVIETYDDQWFLDAELMVNGVSTWWPNYTYGVAPWHMIAIGNMAEADGKLAFSAAKADEKQVEWMSYISGPSLDILASELVTATAQTAIPYAPTMSAYVTADEAAARYANLQAWYDLKKFFWVSDGPYYLDGVFPTENTVTVARNPKFMDLSNKWDRFSEPKMATVEVDGPANVTIGQAADFNVMVYYKDAPYPAAEIDSVSYLVFDATGALAGKGTADAVADGQYKVTLPADLTSKLAAGSNKLEVAVVSKVVSVPAFGAFEFVTAP
jgi:peptide/nickel transport system substrate-binding protein